MMVGRPGAVAQRLPRFEVRGRVPGAMDLGALGWTRPRC